MPRGYRRRGRPINRRGRRSSRGTTGRDDFVRRYGSISSNSDVGGMADLMDGVEQDDGSIESMQMDNNTVGGRAPTRGAGRRGGRFRRGRAVAALDPATIRNEIVQHSCVPCASCKTTFKRYGDGLPGGKIRAARECVACKKGVAVPRIDTVPAYLVPYVCCGEPDYRILSAVRVVDFEPRGQETMPEADARRMASLGPHARRRVKR